MLLDVVYYTLYASSIIGILIVSTLVYLRGGEREHRYFAVFTTLLNLWLALQFFAQLLSIDDTLILRITTAIGPFFALYFFFFTTQYIGISIKQTPHLILPVLTAVVCIGTNLVVREASASFTGIILQDGPLYYVVYALVIGYALTGLGFIVNEIRAKHLSPSRRQADILFIVAVLQAIIIISVVAIFFAAEPISQVLIPFSLFIMIVTFGYAIVRHRLFDIRMAAVRTLAYVFSLATLAGAYSLLAFGLTNILLGARDSSGLQLFYLLVALLLALTFAPLKAFFDKVTRSIFYQDAYESQLVIDELSGVLVSTVSIEDLSRNSAEILRGAMKSEYVAILLPSRRNSKMSEHFFVSGKMPKVEEKELTKLLSKHETKLLIEDDLHQERTKLARSLRSANCAIVARLEAHHDFIGYVLFGVKNNGRPYTRQDIELIHTTTDEVALGIQNALRFEEIRQFNRTLQTKVDTATAQLRQTNTELRRLDEAKDEFVSMASHQLRTPLTSVKGYISMVLEGDVGKITASQRQLLSEAFTSSERMVHLINDFLNVSRLQTGKFMLEQQPVDLAKVVTQEVDSLQTTAKAHELTLRFRPPSYFPILFIDEGKIRQVLMNFIDNAIYYSREHTVITVELTVEDGNAVLMVHDTGIGVPKPEQSHLFTKFFRATNARKQRPDGTGVGLFLAKKVVVAHGGTIVFESVEGEGSTFGFRLPIKPLSTAPAKSPDELKK